MHESRKAVKKVRAALEVLEHSGTEIPSRDRKRLKKAARELSALRDSTAIIDTFDRVRRHYPKGGYPSTPTGPCVAGWSEPRNARNVAHAGSGSLVMPRSSWTRHVWPQSVGTCTTSICRS